MIELLEDLFVLATIVWFLRVVRAGIKTLEEASRRREKEWKLKYGHTIWYQIGTGVNAVLNGALVLFLGVSAILALTPLYEVVLFVDCALLHWLLDLFKFPEALVESAMPDSRFSIFFVNAFFAFVGFVEAFTDWGDDD